jgi:hypothetical protein
VHCHPWHESSKTFARTDWIRTILAGRPGTADRTQRARTRWGHIRVRRPGRRQHLRRDNAPICRFLLPASPSGHHRARPARREVNSPQPGKRVARSVHRLCTAPLREGCLCWSERCSSITSTSKGPPTWGYPKSSQRHRCRPRSSRPAAMAPLEHLDSSQVPAVYTHVTRDRTPAGARPSHMPRWAEGPGTGKIPAQHHRLRLATRGRCPQARAFRSVEPGSGVDSPPPGDPRRSGCPPPSGLEEMRDQLREPSSRIGGGWRDQFRPIGGSWDRRSTWPRTEVLCLCR